MATTTAVRPPRANKVIAGYTVAEWRESLDGMLAAIEAGVFDADLKPIARACFDRRDALKGDATDTDA
jgi:hypothetical protein